MQIDEAIRAAREGADHMEEKARGHEWMFEFRLAHVYRIQAAAIRTVCNEVETLRETCRGYAAALTQRDSGQTQAESDESGDVGEMLGWK